MRMIKLSFSDFNLEEADDCTDGDYLMIADPEGETKVFCGQDHPSSLESVGNSLNISFFSNSANQRGFRFKLSFQTVSQCDDYWKEFGEFCYFFSEDEKNFTDASEDCLSKGGNLASVHSPEEQMFLQKNAKTSTFWIGARPTGGGLTSNAGNFNFLDDSPNDYHNVWDGGSYFLGTCTSTCGIVMMPDKWRTINCQLKRRVICTSETFHGDGWYDIGDFYVHVSTEKKNFEDAEQYCLEYDGSNMLIVSNINEQYRLSSILSKKIFTLPPNVLDTTEFWIGLVKDEVEEWVWVDGSSLTFERWDSGYPQDVTNDCAVMVTSSWDDVYDRIRRAYVCKKKP